MEAPPPYRPKKSKSGLIIGLIIGGVLLCCILPIGGIVGVGYWGMKSAGPMFKCLISTELMHRAVLAYAADNGGKLPTAAKWQDQVRPYYEKELTNPKVGQNPFGVMPAAGQWGCEASDGVVTTLTFNSALSGKKLDDIKDQAETVLFFETKNPGGNANAKYDAKNLGDPPKRFPTAFWLVVPVNGDAKLLDKNGERLKDEGKMRGSFKMDF